MIKIERVISVVLYRHDRPHVIRKRFTLAAVPILFITHFRYGA